MSNFSKQIKKLNKRNEELFEEKAELEQRILDIDIEIFELFGEFNKLVFKNENKKRTSQN